MADVGRTLLLVDGSSYLYRAFHALPDLRNAAGEPTGALFGVLNMLRRLQADYKADYLACVFDAKGKTFRDDLYPQYKAQRPPMPDDLAAQIRPLLETIAALGWPLLQIEGVEADDVIGTLARQAERRGIRTVISTGDKDLAQLVTPAVTLVNTMSNERLDEAGVEQKFGVRPERILDYLTLVGDAVDNVPGVQKVGPKTALKWLQQYGSLDGVIAHAGEIGGVVGENLRAALEWLPKARELLRVKCDVALPVAPEGLVPQPREEQELAALFNRFGLKSWLKEAQSGVAPERAAAQAAPAAALTPAPAPAMAFAAGAARNYETVLTAEALKSWRAQLAGAPLASIDTETSSLDPMAARLVGMSFSIAPGEAAYVPLAHDYAGAPAQIPLAEALAILKAWLEDANAQKLG
ncbi:MAG: DNA polymerase I, partial [Betaproteobacteria bacterium]|nr:DNA polymerase I [Betaproteobacteria bacterium]